MSDGWPLDSLPCDDPRADLLLESARGELDADAARDVAEHLSDCAVCRERNELWVALVGAARRSDDPLADDHPTSERLVAYAANGISSPDAGEIERHLQGCGSCALDLRMLQSVDRSLHADERLRPRRRLTPRRGWLWAYAAVLTLMVPAAAMLGHWYAGGADRSLVRPLPPPRVLVLAERSVESIPHIPIPAGSELCLEFQVPVLEEAGVRYDAILFDATEQEIWRHEGLRPVDEFGAFRLLLDASRLGPGDHRLRVVERSGSEPGERFEFPFRLTQ